MNLRTKALLLMSAFLIATNVVLGAALMHQTRQSLKSLIDDHMLSVVNTAADMIDGSALETITKDSKGSAEYNKLYQTLSVFQNNIGLEFIYAVRQAENGSFILVIDPAKENIGEYGTVIHETEALHKAANGTASVDQKPYRDSFGYFYSAYSPVSNAEGKVAGIIAADFNAEWYESQLNRNTRTLIIVCVLSLGICIAVILFLTKEYNRQFDSIQVSLRELEDYINTLTSDMTEKKKRKDRLIILKF